MGCRPGRGVSESLVPACEHEHSRASCCHKTQRAPACLSGVNCKDFFCHSWPRCRPAAAAAGTPTRALWMSARGWAGCSAPSCGETPACVASCSRGARAGMTGGGAEGPCAELPTGLPPGGTGGQAQFPTQRFMRRSIRQERCLGRYSSLRLAPGSAKKAPPPPPPPPPPPQGARAGAGASTLGGAAR